MKIFGIFFLALGTLTSAHYTFDTLVVNGQQRGTGWQYVRQHTRTYMPTKGQAILENDFRCNQASQANAARTQTFTVRPGDKVALKQAYGGTGMAHPGPTQVYLSRAPGDVSQYDGSGEWLKVYQSLVCRNDNQWTTDAWCMWNEDRIEFEIPSTVPNGQYLARVEHIALHGAHIGETEFYYACAQINIEGSSATTFPGTKVRIPGVYSLSDAAINFSVWNSPSTYSHIPGPSVGPGGTIRGNPNGSAGFAISRVPLGPPPSSGTPPPNSGSGSPLYGQCGGQEWTGSTTCLQGTCQRQNDWYSQCLL